MANCERRERSFLWRGKTWRWDWGGSGRLPGFVVTNERAPGGSNGTGQLPGFVVTNHPTPNLYEGRGDSEAEEEEEATEQAPPVTRVMRKRVEEDVPRRNFGDFDPVDLRKAPRHGMCHVEKPLKLEKRRVLYKGIGDKQIRDHWNCHKSTVFETEDFDEAYNRSTNSPEEPGSYRTAKPEPESGFSQGFSSAEAEDGQAYNFVFNPQSDFKTEPIDIPPRNEHPPSTSVFAGPCYSTMLRLGLQARSNLSYGYLPREEPRRERDSGFTAQSFREESLSFAERTSGFGSRLAGPSRSSNVTFPPRSAAAAAGFEDAVYRNPRNGPQVKVEAVENTAGNRDPTKVARTMLDPFRVPIHREPSIILDTKPKHWIRYGVGYYYD